VRLAVTGGTGFVGSHLLDLAVAAGHRVRALTRRPMPERTNVDWVSGALDRRDALEELVRSSDAVIHIAGVINPPDPREFERGNVEGTLSLLAAATATGTCRFVHVSSLAAREPAISLYGASKARAEEFVERSGLDWAIVRPPAVYGPGDRETLELFKMARLGLVMLPPAGRLSLLHVDDLARLLLALADPQAPAKTILEPDDGRAGGWSHREFARALGGATGRRNIAVPVPGALLRFGALADRAVRGAKAKLTPDRAAYFSHPDWVADPARAASPAVWRAEVPTDRGLAETANWYRQEGWL
jgi:nucleoside-diphosphate-sugar epimerase